MMVEGAGDIAHDAHAIGFEVEDANRDHGSDHDDKGGRSTRSNPLEHGAENPNNAVAPWVSPIAEATSPTVSMKCSWRGTETPRMRCTTPTMSASRAAASR